MKVIYDTEKQLIPIYSWCDEIEESALKQALDLSNHPVAVRHVALMPDCHTGMGMPIGGVIALRGAISPAMVGVDIGCGMCAMNSGHKTNIAHVGAIKDIRAQITRDIPVGFEHRDPKWEGRGRELADELALGLFEKYANTQFLKELGAIITMDAVIGQLGTLGGGNHFCELQEDENGYVWAMIHSGSRNLGLQIAEHYNGKAMTLCARWYSDLPNSAVSFLPLAEQVGQDYVEAMNFALDFAFANRILMMDLVAYAFHRNKVKWPDDWRKQMINIHHNYATMENHHGENLMVHRKGATLARTSVTGIIPGSMGTNSYIVKGKGNEKSFMSCSHGAGRKMSRSEAKKKITMDAFKHKMKGIEYDPIKDNLDEAPQAYKDIDEVMAQQDDLVEIVHKLTPRAVIKG